MPRTLFSSGSPWEAKVGYSRAVQVGNLLFVSPTAATGPDGNVVAHTVYEQTVHILATLGRVLAEAGFSFDDVVQSRVAVSDFENWSGAAQAHGEVFATVRPAFTLVHALPFVDPEILVEVELVAMRPMP
jgi:enamine deaminase RidA (YjgF/YER057c/UK114 family)